MDLSTLSHGVHKRKLKKRVGRGIGSGHGKTGSRGTKGQYASAGAELPRAIFEGGQMPLFRKIPKRGFGTEYAPSTFRSQLTVPELTASGSGFNALLVQDETSFETLGSSNKLVCVA